MRALVSALAVLLLLSAGCGRFGFDELLGGGDELDPPPPGTVQFAVDAVSPDTLYGSFSGTTVDQIGDLVVLDAGGSEVATAPFAGTADRFAVPLGAAAASGQTVTLEVRSKDGTVLFTGADTFVPVDQGLAFDLRSLHLSFFTNDFYIGLNAAGTHCLSVVDDHGEVHGGTGGDGCITFDDTDSRLVALTDLTGTFDINRGHALCDEAPGATAARLCTPLEPLRNHMAVDQLVLQPGPQIFSIQLASSLSQCVRIIDESQTQIVLTDSGSAHACVGTYISGYATQDIPLAELTAPIDGATRYSICNIDTRGLGYSVCTPLELPVTQ